MEEWSLMTMGKSSFIDSVLPEILKGLEEKE
jgi:hypothetical protein